MTPLANQLAAIFTQKMFLFIPLGRPHPFALVGWHID